VHSWKQKLPLQTIMRLLQVLVPQVEKICIDKSVDRQFLLILTLSRICLRNILDVTIRGCEIKLCPADLVWYLVTCWISCNISFIYYTIYYIYYTTTTDQETCRIASVSPNHKVFSKSTAGLGHTRPTDLSLVIDLLNGILFLGRTCSMEGLALRNIWIGRLDRPFG